MQRHLSYAIAFLICIFLTHCTSPTTKQPDEPHSAGTIAADSIVAAAVASNQVSGAVLLVSQENKVVFKKGYGFAQQFAYGGAQMASPVEMTPDHIFDLASLTKVFATTMGFMLLVDEGKVLLNAPVKTYLPAFSSAQKDSITVRHLLTHSAGLYPWKPTYYHAADKQQTFAFINQLDLAYPVGEARHYSDPGFMLLGYVIEAVSGQPLDAYLQDALYNKLNLKNTGFNLTRSPEVFAATSHGNPFEMRMVADDNFGYVCEEDPDDFTGWRERVLIGEVNDGNAYYAHQGVAGHAGLFSTASDLHVLLNLLLNKGQHNGEQVISSATVTQFLTMDALGNGLGWAMSPGIIYSDVPGAFGHTGFTGTYALGVPEKKLGIILLTNRQHAGVLEDGRYPSLTALRRNVVTALLDDVQ